MRAAYVSELGSANPAERYQSASSAEVAFDYRDSVTSKTNSMTYTHLGRTRLPKPKLTPDELVERWTRWLKETENRHPAGC